MDKVTHQDIRVYPCPERIIWSLEKVPKHVSEKWPPLVVSLVFPFLVFRRDGTMFCRVAIPSVLWGTEEIHIATLPFLVVHADVFDVASPSDIYSLFFKVETLALFRHSAIDEE